MRRIARILLTATALTAAAWMHAAGAQDLDDQLAEAERLSVSSNGAVVQDLLDRIGAALEGASERQRHQYELLRIRAIARAGRLDEASEASVALVEQLDAMDPDLAQRTLNLATNVLVVNDRFDEGFRYFRRALDRAPEVEDPEMRAGTYSVAAEFYDRIGETATALTYADQALALSRMHGLDRSACVALERGGRAQLHSGHWSDAATRLERAVTACETADESVFAAQARFGLARALSGLGQTESAEAGLQAALEAFERSAFPEGVLEVRVDLAERALDRGDLSEAERQLQLAEPRLDAPGDLGIRARAWALRATLAERSGDQARALEWLRRAVQLRQDRSERQRAMRIALLINENDTEARARELALLRDRNRALELEQERRQQADLGLLYGGGGALVAAVLVVLLLVKTGRDRKRFQRMSQHDGLTGLLNHTRFFQLAHLAFQRCLQSERPFTMVVADIDLFKQINDQHGHLVGDAILARTGRCLREAFQDDALLGRLGGEEFGIALSNVDTDAAVARIEHLRALINRDNPADEPDITLSFGVAERGRERHLDALYARADQALYDAKDAGRDRVVTVARLALSPARFTT